MEGTMTPEIPFIKDGPTRFLSQTIFDPVIAQKLAPPPEIAETTLAKRQKKETLTKVIQQIKDLNFTPVQVDSLLKKMLNGLATEARGWNQGAIRASLTILPFIGLKKLNPGKITENYMGAVTVTLPSNLEVIAERGLEALIEAGMILVTYISPPSNRQKIDTEVIPVLRQELEKRHSYTNSKTYEILVGKIDNLSNALKTGLTKPIEIKPIDTTEIANKFRELSEESLSHTPEQFARLDLLVAEAIRHFGMGRIEIIKMSGIKEHRIRASIRRLKVSGSIPAEKVYENSLGLQAQKLLRKGPLTQSQIAHALGPGVTVDMVTYANRRLRKWGNNQEPNSPQERKSLEERIIELTRQGLSNSQIVDQLDISLLRVRRLTAKLRREGKIEQRTRGAVDLNHPVVRRAMLIDARVNEIRSNHPGITQNQVAKKLNLPRSSIKLSFLRLEVHKQIEQLIQQEKTAAQIADERGISIRRAEFLIARSQKLREVQLTLQNHQPSTQSPSTG